MKEPRCVKITVQGSDIGDDSISLSTRGHLQEMDHGWLLTYEGINPADMSTTQTLLHCSTDTVTVTRAGPLVSTLIFREQETYVSTYPTPLGMMEIRIFTTEVVIRRRGAIGHIRVVYQISLSTPHSAAEESTLRTLDVRFTPCRN